jgi:hypothetical protein
MAQVLHHARDDLPRLQYRILSTVSLAARWPQPS